MPYAKYHDTTYSPAGLWQLNNDLTDASGNGFTLTVDAGTVRYTDVYPGLRGIIFDGSTRLIYNAATATLQITGDVTLEMLFIPLTRTITGKYLSCNASGGSAGSDNYLYSVGFNTSVSSGSWEWQSQHGTNTSDTYDIPNNPTLNALNHVAVTRTSNVVQNYLNGVAWGAASSGLTTPTGGSISKFRIGGSSGVNGPTCIIASVKVIASALTSAQVKSEYNNTLGNFYGYL